MDRLFNMDNKFFTFMGKVADLMILNVIFIICCIPIVTIGPALTAMNYVTLKMARNEESYIIRSFLKSFKENLKQGILIWLIMLVLGIVLITDYMIMRNLDSGFMQVIKYGLGMITFIYLMVMLYIFPLLSKFDNTLKNTFKNAILMSIRHLPFTILMMLITYIPLGATILLPIVLVYGAIVWIMIGFSLIAFINAKFFVKIFDKYIPHDDEEEEGVAALEESPLDEQALEDTAAPSDDDEEETESANEPDGTRIKFLI